MEVRRCPGGVRPAGFPLPSGNEGKTRIFNRIAFPRSCINGKRRPVLREGCRESSWAPGTRPGKAAQTVLGPMTHHPIVLSTLRPRSIGPVSDAERRLYAAMAEQARKGG